MIDNESFWPLAHSSKADVLQESKHSYIILRALNDPVTQIEPDGSDWILYSNEEALLVRPSSCYLKIVMLWYCHLMQIMTPSYHLSDVESPLHT